jgi:hypothetical protein
MAKKHSIISCWINRVLYIWRKFEYIDRECHLPASANIPARRRSSDPSFSTYDTSIATENNPALAPSLIRLTTRPKISPVPARNESILPLCVVVRRPYHGLPRKQVLHEVDLFPRNKKGWMQRGHSCTATGLRQRAPRPSRVGSTTAAMGWNGMEVKVNAGERGDNNDKNNSTSWTNQPLASTSYPTTRIIHIRR